MKSLNLNESPQIIVHRNGRQALANRGRFLATMEILLHVCAVHRLAIYF
jgi:hypothetical protein